MTAFSPAAVALNDMLRQQLDLTTQFISTQKRLHFALINSLDTAYNYTTLHETKEVAAYMFRGILKKFIHQHG